MAFGAIAITRIIDPTIQASAQTCRGCIGDKPQQAGEERLFSMVRKNKTDSRSALGLEGTLSSLLSMKLHYSECSTPCYTWKP